MLGSVFTVKARGEASQVSEIAASSFQCDGTSDEIWIFRCINFQSFKGKVAYCKIKRFFYRFISYDLGYILMSF